MRDNQSQTGASTPRLRIIRYSFFTVWFGILITGFLLAGGIKGIDPLHKTENVVSIDEPMKFIIYYLVVLLLFVLSVTIGKRGGCHTICWMSPFLVAGLYVGRALRLPQLRIKADASACISCKKCNQVCPMSIDVCSETQKGEIRSSDCILCGECVDTCPKNVLRYGRSARH